MAFRTFLNTGLTPTAGGTETAVDGQALFVFNDSESAIVVTPSGAGLGSLESAPLNKKSGRFLPGTAVAGDVTISASTTHQTSAATGAHVFWFLQTPPGTGVDADVPTDNTDVDGDDNRDEG